MATTTVTQRSAKKVPTIDNPCQHDLTSKTTRHYLPLKDQIQSIIAAANNTASMLQRYRDAMKTVLTLHETGILDSPLENIPGLPLGLDDPVCTSANMISSFTKDYRDVSTYIMYLEFVKSSMITTDKNDGNQFLGLINDIITQMFCWLCKISTILQSQNSPVTTFVDPSVLATEVLEYSIDSKSRYSIIMSS